MRRLSQKDGFSLIEVLTVLTISSIIFPMMMVIMGGMAQQSTKATIMTVATDQAREMMELILVKQFDDFTRSDPATGNWTLVANLGPEGCPSSCETRANFNDIDDFDGFSDTPAPGYSRSVEVVYATLDANPPTPVWVAETTTETNYKRITVDVTHNSIGTISLVTLAGGFGN